MSITFGHSGEWEQSQIKGPCDRCSQFKCIDPQCWLCKGTGEQSVYCEQPGSFNLCNANAKAFLVMLLGHDVDMWRMSSIPLTKARQRLWVTRARFDSIAKQYTRATTEERGERRQRGNIHELHAPVFRSEGLGVERLRQYLDMLEKLIDIAGDAGAESIIWG